MRPPSTSAIAARAATTSLVFFNNRLSPPFLLASPVEVSKGPSGFRSEASDHGKPEAGDRNRRKRDRAEVRDQRQVEEHESCSVAEKGAKRLHRAHRAQAAERGPEADSFRKPGPDESLGIRAWALDENGLGWTDQEGCIRPERGAVKRGVGYGQKHSQQSECPD